MNERTPESSAAAHAGSAGSAAADAGSAAAYTPREMMAIAAGRFIGDGDVLFAGTGVAMLAATVAKRIHAPHAHIFFETGGIGPQLDELPMAVADPRVMAYANLNAGLIEAFSYLANRRLHTIAFLGAAQIDRYGNMNSTVIGDYRSPQVRFSGSGGACDAGSLASAFIVFMQHGRRKFVEKLDYLTTPGWLEGGDSRSRAGYRRGGPLAVVTNLCVLRFREDTKAMYLAERFPGVSVEEIVENTGFELDVEGAEVAEPPSAEELRILRDDVDPQRLILG
jgi:glutaconate CoA-transferase, subunit B